MPLGRKTMRLGLEQEGDLRSAQGNVPVAWRLAMHGDAFLRDPKAYIASAWWRLLGKRLRAWIRLAPLLGQSRWAYRIWQRRENQTVVGQVEGSPDIYALVIGTDRAAETRASLASEGIAMLPDNSLHDGWILPIYAGDVLAPGAGKAYRRTIKEAPETARIIYADDDLLAANGLRSTPHFKPDWNSELFHHFDYLTGSAMVKVERTDLTELSQDGRADLLITKATQVTPEGVVHLPMVLHHRRSRPAPQRPAALDLSPEQRAALPPVTVVIPTRNRVDLLRTCLEGLQATDYPAPLEVLVVDNGSDDPATLDYLSSLDPAFARVLPMPGPFNFAALNNAAAQQATGELLCLLNNDIEISDPHWLTALATQAMRPDVGAVGAQLLYPDGRVQHAGVALGIGGGAAHVHRLLRPEEEGYFHRHALPQFVSAVTAACLVVAREKFLAVGGFDAENFAVAFNDVDLCLKLNERGWQSLYEPRASLIHHESVSRGLDRDPTGSARLEKELKALQDRWSIAPATASERTVDPWHHPQLSPFSERFVVDI